MEAAAVLELGSTLGVTGSGSHGLGLPPMSVITTIILIVALNAELKS